MKVLVTGATGLVGTALVGVLGAGGDEVVALGSGDAGLRDAAAADAVLAFYRPEIVYHLAARVWVRGIMDNAGSQGDAFLDGTPINTTTIDAARRAGVHKMVAMGSAAIYAMA